MRCWLRQGVVKAAAEGPWEQEKDTSLPVGQKGSWGRGCPGGDEGRAAVGPAKGGRESGGSKGPEVREGDHCASCKDPLVWAIWVAGHRKGTQLVQVRVGVMIRTLRCPGIRGQCSRVRLSEAKQPMLFVSRPRQHHFYLCAFLPCPFLSIGLSSLSSI